MKIETKVEVEKLSPHSSRMFVRVFVEGKDCGTVTIISGSTHDVAQFEKGEIGWKELEHRWVVDERFSRPKIR